MIERLVFELMSAGGDTPPTEFRLFSYGKTGTTKGEYDFDEDDADECMRAFRDYGNRLTVDYEHQALSDPPVQSPAAASFVIEKRTDGLWATDVRWTAKASEYLKNREYLYFSPAFVKDKTGSPRRLVNVALTNIPATKGMTSLVAASQRKGNHMITVLKALGLGDDADEAQALSAVHKMGALKAQVLALSGKDSVDEAIGVLTAQKAQAEKAVALAAELETARQEKAQLEVCGLLDEAVKDGRVAPAKRAEMEALYRDCGLKALTSCLSLLPKASAPAVALSDKASAPSDASGLTRAELKIIKDTGLTVEQFTAHRTKYRQLTNPTEEQ